VTFSRRQKWIFAAATALLWWAAGLPAAFFALGWLAFVPLFILCSGLSPWQRFKWGYITGWLSYALINWWIILSIMRGAPAIGASATAGFFLGVVAVALIGLIHGFGVATIALLCRRATRVSLKVLLCWPLLIAALWWGLEWLRAQSVLGHTWGALAYTQWSDLYSLQVVSVIGRNGLSAWCIWLAAMLALTWQWRREQQKRYIPAGMALAGLAALHGWGMWLYHRPEPAGSAPLKVLLVQTTYAGISHGMDDNEGFEQARKLTRDSLARHPVDLVIWPESTFSLGQGSAASMEDEAWVRQFCRTHKIPLLTGTKHWTADGRLYNDATLFAPDGGTQGNAKKWLVPFGERAPFGDIWPALNRFAPEPAVTPAPRKVPLLQDFHHQTLQLGTLICFESSFAAPFRLLRQQGAQLLLVLTNDSWFAGSEAPWAHAAMSAVAAVENRTPVVQAANGGYCFAIDRKGRFIAKSTFGKQEALFVEIAPNR